MADQVMRKRDGEEVVIQSNMSEEDAFILFKKLLAANRQTWEQSGPVIVGEHEVKEGDIYYIKEIKK